jgi:DNA uptake protein ComE-like DNA-binding protein
VLLLLAVIMLAATCVIAVNRRPAINTADSGALYDALVRVDGVGPFLAGEIVKQRPYNDWQDLIDRVDGVGEERSRELKLKFNLD